MVGRKIQRNNRRKNNKHSRKTTSMARLHDKLQQSIRKFCYKRQRNVHDSKQKIRN
jgi:KaiC/GvpD/RAD55 family RecA-like ATPase